MKSRNESLRNIFDELGLCLKMIRVCRWPTLGLLLFLSLSVLLASHAAFASNKSELESELGSSSGDGLDTPAPSPRKKSPTLSYNRGKPKKKVPAANQTDSLELDVEDAPSPVDTAAGGKSTPAAPEVISPATQAKIAQADALSKKNQWAQVASLLKPVMQQLSRDGLFLLANAYAMTKSPAEEVRVLDLSSHKYPNDAAILTRLGQACSKQGRKDEAMENLYAARDANPQYKPTFEALLAELQKQENFYEARVLVQDMIKKFGDEPKYVSSYCALLTHDAFLQNAVEVCSDALKKDPQDFKNYINLALSLKDKLEPDKAAKTLAEATALFPREALVFYNQAMLFMDTKNYVSANAAFTRATVLAPKNTDAWIGLANSDIELHRYKEALSAYVSACKIDPRAVKDFRAVAARLHHEGELDWQVKFTDSVSSCTSQF